MNILLVSSFLPFPLTSGGHVRLFNIIKRLSKNHTIFLVCEKRNYQTEVDSKELKKYCKEVLVADRKKQWSVSNILKAGVSTHSFLTTGHTNQELTEHIKNIIKNNSIDVIHCETFYVMHNIPETQIPIVLVEHNIEYQVYERYVNTVALLLKPFLYIDIAKLKAEELKSWKNATKLVAVSEEEKKQMTRKDVTVVPNGVDLNQFRVQSSEFRVDKKEKTVLFIGDFRWIQNKIAAEWLLQEIWPLFSSEFRVQNSEFDIKLWIVGKNIPDEIKSLTADENVLFDENAPSETEEIFKKADVLVSPTAVGGGTSFKILEAMASGVPVVTTALGIEGINAEDKKDFLLANTTSEFVDAISQVLTRQEVYEKIARNARKKVEEQYDWDTIVPKLEKVYESASL